MIRYANKNDVDKIAYLYEDLDKVHRDNVTRMFKLVTINDRRNTILTDIDQENVRYIVADFDGEIKGFAKLLIKTVPDNHPVLLPQTIVHIEEMAVCEKRKGFGKKLIKYIEEEITKEFGAKIVTLQVMDFNNEAKKFYSEVGFETMFYGMRKTF